jgi:predicted amidophosphoribosyltransferase
LRSLADRALAALFEPPCPACGRINERPLDGAICAPCWESIVPLTPPLCVGCGDALPSWRSASLLASTCPRCRRQPRTVCRMAAFGPYEGTLRAVIHALKYGGRRTAAPPLSALMRETGAAVLLGADAVVPVPLHPFREWSRGFNQATLLARGLGLPVLPILKRVRHTTPQAALPAARRHRNVRNAFAIDAGTEVPALQKWDAVRSAGASILGLLTSGSTPRRNAGTEAPALQKWDAVRSAGASILGLLTSGSTPRRSAGTEAPALQKWDAVRSAGASAPAYPVHGLTLVLVDDVTTTGATLEACARVLMSAGAREVRALTAARVVTSPPQAPPR